MASRNGFAYPLVILGIGCAILFGLLALQTKRLESAKAEHAAFVAQVKVMGEEAERKRKEQEAKDKAEKEKADVENQTNRSRIADLSRRLRNERASSRFVPAAPTGTKSPDRIAFDRAELERAIQRLDGGVSAIVAEGDQARVDLDTAKRWAKGVESRP